MNTRRAVRQWLDRTLSNVKDPQNRAFEIRVRAAKQEPDMFNVNRCMRLGEDLQVKLTSGRLVVDL